MNNSETPTGANGKKELNKRKNEVTVRSASDDEVREKWNNFFEGEELEFNSFYFDVPEESRIIGGDEQEEHTTASPILNVLAKAKYEFEVNKIIEAVTRSIKREDLEKIKRVKTRQVEKRLKAKLEQEKKSAGGTEKPGESKEDR